MSTLVVAPHYDDAELGASLALPGARLLVVAGADRNRRAEQERACRALGASLAPPGQVPDGRVGADTATVLLIEAAIRDADARIVYGPAALDSHQDHRAVAAAIRSAARRAPVTLVEYETTSALPEWTPNVWEPMTDADLEAQAVAVAAHASQADRPYVDPGYLRARAVVHGAVIGAPYAQAYRVTRGAALLGGRR